MNIVKPSIDLGVVVSDVAASLRFYCEDLGLEKIGEIELPGNRTMHRLQAGDSMIKLQELHDERPPAGPTGITAQVGLRYFTIWVSGLEQEVARLAERGCKFVRELQQIRPGVFIAMLEDPDGNTVELLEVVEQETEGGDA